MCTPLLPEPIFFSAALLRAAPLHGLLWLLYLALASWIWWHTRRASAAGNAPSQYLPPHGAMLLGGLLLAHGPLVALALFSPACLGWAQGLEMLAWLLLGVCWVGGYGLAVASLQRWALWGMVVVLGGAILLPGSTLEQYALDGEPRWSTRLHIVIALLAYGLATISAGLALLVYFSDRQLHRHHAHTLIRYRLPPMLVLEKLLFVTVLCVFVLFSITLGLSWFFPPSAQGNAHRYFSWPYYGIAWAVFGIMLLGIHWRGWRGRTAAIMVLLLFTLLGLPFLPQLGRG